MSDEPQGNSTLCGCGCSEMHFVDCSHLQGGGCDCEDIAYAALGLNPEPEPEQQQFKGEYGTCGFCGIGDGWLGEQGDERSELLHSAVRTGEPGEWEYHPHENSIPDNYAQYIRWCGGCIGGLIHKYQRYDDTNLRAKLVSSRVRRDLDPLRFNLWDAAHRGSEEAKLHTDDPGTHIEKLNAYDAISQMEAEMQRRAGFDLTKNGWRP